MNWLKELQHVYPEGEAKAIHRMVMEVRFGLSQTDLLLGKDKDLSPEDLIRLEIIMHRLLRKEPVQYVLGEANFCGKDFHVEPGILIPRPETEDLIPLVSRYGKAQGSLLDIGTGSGCIAVTSALHGFQVTAIDISPIALRIAQMNAERYQADVEFLQEDILHPTECDRKWNIIVSNPPYICQHEATDMEDNVLLYEPHVALFVPDEDPLLFYRTIIIYGTRHLTQGGTLLFETNRAFTLQVCDLMQEYGYTDCHPFNDRYGNPRFVVGHLKQENPWN